MRFLTLSLTGCVSLKVLTNVYKTLITHEYKITTSKPLLYNDKCKDLKLYLHHDYSDVKMGILMDRDGKEILGSNQCILEWWDISDFFKCIFFVIVYILNTSWKEGKMKRYQFRNQKTWVGILVPLLCSYFILENYLTSLGQNVILY